MAEASPAKLLCCVVLIILYLTLGGYIFIKLEADNEAAEIAEAIAIQKQLKKSLKDNPEVAIRVSKLMRRAGMTRPEPLWTMEGSIFFCLTVATTVGYGNVAPSTENGQIFCIFYAICGIPLLNVAAQESNRCLKALMKQCLSRLCVCKQYCAKSGHILAIAVFVLALTLASAAIFHRTEADEEMTFFQALYMTAITLTTIGFGDFSPGSKPGRSYMICLVLLGFGPVSMLLDMIGWVWDRGLTKLLECIKFRICKSSRVLAISGAEGALDAEKAVPLKSNANDNQKSTKPPEKNQGAGWSNIPGHNFQ
mmetsp:Transcript_50977/g.99940  ORF Transcript_50977/g.99940 Transcript_50977/m.99940 type:complete len:309 (+) Transcript_50977:76-1002(+)